MAWHSLLKEVLLNLLGAEMSVQVEYEVGSLPLKIDMIIRKSEGSGGEIQQQVERAVGSSEQVAAASPPLHPDLFESVQYLTKFKSMLTARNIFEFKLMEEPMTLPKLSKLVGYFALFCQREELSTWETVQETSSWLLCTRKPHKLLDTLENRVHPLKVPGFYRLDYLVPRLYLIVISELPLEDEFLPFLLFSAKGPRRDAVLRYLLRNEKNLFITWGAILYLEELQNVAKTEGIELDEWGLSIRKSIRMLGIKNVVEQVGLKEVVIAVGVEELIKAVGVEKLIKAVGVEELLRRVDLDTLEAMVKERREKEK